MEAGRLGLEGHVGLGLGPQVQVERALAEAVLPVEEVDGGAGHHALRQGPPHVVEGDAEQRDGRQVAVTERDGQPLVDLEGLVQAREKFGLEWRPVKAQFYNAKVLQSDFFFGRLLLGSAWCLDQLVKCLFFGDVVELADGSQSIFIDRKQIVLVFFSFQEAKHIIEVSDELQLK